MLVGLGLFDITGKGERLGKQMLVKYLSYEFQTDLDQTLFEKTWHFNLFTAETATRLHMINVAKDYFSELNRCALGDSPYMLCSIAMTKNCLQGKDSMRFM